MARVLATASGQRRNRAAISGGDFSQYWRFTFRLSRASDNERLSRMAVSAS